METKKIQYKIRLIVAIVIAFVICGFGGYHTWYNRTGDYPETIKMVEDAIEREIKNMGKETIKLRDKETGKVTELVDDLGIYTWEKIEKITKNLTSITNARIAKAKALIHYEKNPISSSYSLWKDLWEYRYKISQEEWRIQTFFDRTLKSIGIAISAFIGSIICTLLSLSFIPWIWYFLLDRIKEFSKAIQGK